MYTVMYILTCVPTPGTVKSLPLAGGVSDGFEPGTAALGHRASQIHRCSTLKSLAKNPPYVGYVLKKCSS